MTRLRTLLAALPEIIPIVEAIADETMRHRVFDLLVQAALDDAASTPAMLPAPVTLSPGNGRLDVAQIAEQVTWSTRTGGVCGTPADITAPAVVDLDGQRLTGTYTGDGRGGTFTPDLGLASDVPTYDAVQSDRS